MDLQGPQISPHPSERELIRRSASRSDSRDAVEGFGEMAAGFGSDIETMDSTAETDATGWFADITGMMAIGVLDWSGSTIDQGLRRQDAVSKDRVLLPSKNVYRYARKVYHRFAEKR